MINCLCYTVVIAVCGDVTSQLLDRFLCIAHSDRHTDRPKHLCVVIAVTNCTHFFRTNVEHLSQPNQCSSFIYMFRHDLKVVIAGACNRNTR